MWDEKVQKLIYYLQIEISRITVNAVKLDKIIKNRNDYDIVTYNNAVLELQKDKGKLEALKVVAGLFTI